MVRKKEDDTSFADAVDTTDTEVPELIRNTGTISDSEVVALLGEGFQQVAARAIPSTEVLGQPTLLARDDKSFLVGMNLLILGWRFNQGDFNAEFVSALVLTEAEQYFVFNDSSTGVYRQLKEITSRIDRQYGPIHIPNGLRASDYWLDEDTGKTYTVKPDDVRTIPARTYYLS